VLKTVSQCVLQLSDLSHHGKRVLRLLSHFGLEFLVFLPNPLDLLSELHEFLVGLYARVSLALHARSLAVIVFGRLNDVGWRGGSIGVGVDTA
jgi:hypothetical protein